MFKNFKNFFEHNEFAEVERPRLSLAQQAEEIRYTLAEQPLTTEDRLVVSRLISDLAHILAQPARTMPASGQVVLGPPDPPSVLDRLTEDQERPTTSVPARSLDELATSALAKAAWCRAPMMAPAVPDWPGLPENADLQLLTDRFEAVGLAAERLSQRPQPHDKLLAYAALAQSALMSSLKHSAAPIDCDQLALFQWLYEHAKDRGVFIHRHMKRLDTPSEEQLAQTLLALRAMSVTPEKDAPHPVPSSVQPPGKGKDITGVKALRNYLAGRHLLIIGSDVPNVTFIARCKALGIQVTWRTFRHSESPLNLRSDIRQPEVAVVVVAVRWSAHSTKQVKPLCREYDKDFVMLPAGYGLNTLAREVLQQVGRRQGENDQATANIGGNP